LDIDLGMMASGAPRLPRERRHPHVDSELPNSTAARAKA
jgi:hypothetical protein